MKKKKEKGKSKKKIDPHDCPIPPTSRPSTFQYSASFATGLAPIGERATLCRERFVSIPQDHRRLLSPPSFAFCFHPRAGYISSTCPPRYVQPRYDPILRLGDCHATNHGRDGRGGGGTRSNGERGFSRFWDRATVPISKIPSKGIDTTR